MLDATTEIGAKDGELPQALREEVEDLLGLARAVADAEGARLLVTNQSGDASVTLLDLSSGEEAPGDWGKAMERAVPGRVSEQQLVNERSGEADGCWLASAGVSAPRLGAKAVLAFWRAGPDKMSDAQREAVERVARQIGRALESARWERERDRTIEQFADAERVASFGHWVLELESGRLSWSDEVYRIFGVEPRAFGETFEAFLSFVHPEDRPALLAAQERGVSGKEPLSHEHRIVRPDGGVRHVLERGELMPANDAQGKRFAGVVLDVTRRKEAELALRREESRYRTLFNHLPDLAFVHRANRIEAMNAAGVSLLGFERAEQVIGRSPLEFVHPGDHAMVATRLSKLREAAPTTAPHEVIRAVLPTGEIRHLETCASSFPSKEGGVSVQVVCRDVTRRVELERRLEESSRMMAVAGRLVRMGAWRYDIAEQRLTWSDEVAKIHGREPGFSPSVEDGIDYYVPEHRERIREAFARCCEEGTPFDDELMIETAQGERVWVRAIGLLQLDASGRPQAVHGAFQDIGEQKRVEAELVQREEERRLAVERLTATLESITDAFFTLDRDWRFTYVNGEAERVLRSRRSELLGMSIWDAFAAAQGSIFEREYRRALEQRRSVTFEAPYEPLDAWFEVNAYPSKDGLAVYFRDVTKRREAEKRMRFLETCVERMNDGVLVTEAWPLDEPGPRITFVNEAFERISGYRADELIGRSPRLFQGPETDPAELARIRAALERCEAVQSTLVNYTKDGKAHWLEMNITPLRNEAGGPTHFLAVQRDVTERKERQEALKEREQALSVLMNGLPGLVYLCSPEGRLLRWNREVERVLRYRGEELAGINVLELIAESDRERTVERIEQVFREGSAEDTLRLRTKDGAEIPFLVRAGKTHAQGQSRLLGVAVDASERQRVENKMRRQAALLDQTQDAIFALASDGEITYWNAAAERLYGWSADEALSGLRLESIFKDPSQARTLIAATRENGSWNGELKQRSRDDRALMVEARWRLLPEDGWEDPSSILVVNTDISERKRLEEQFMRAQRMEAIGTLAGGIAHDLNNILSPILLSIDLLRSRTREERNLRTLATIEAAGRRGAEIVKQVLSFARGLGGEQVVTAPKHVVNEMVSLLRETFPRSIGFSVSVSRDVGSILADPTQLHQALMNLCVNARDAMPDGGTLTITVAPAEMSEERLIGGIKAAVGRYVTFTISDTGCGMSEEVKSRIFDPFYSTKGEGKGTGLGLPTVQGVVKAHSGFLEVESSPGKGSSFRVWFPALTQTDGDGEAGADGELPRGRGETILVVDDEEPVRTIAKETLEEFGYKVLVAENGAKALSTFHREGRRIDVLVTDMMMPVMDGAALIRGVRRSAPDLPIIVTSGFTAEASKAREAEAEGAQLVAKPYSTETMLHALAKALRSSDGG